MSSHREAPEISMDPAADGTDVYAFMHPTLPNQVVLIANFIPLQKPDSGPNFFEFSDDVRYTINISNTDSAEADISYEFKFRTAIRNPNTFLYNTGPINSIKDETWNRPQDYSVTKRTKGRARKITGNLLTAPCNVGLRSTPDYAKLSKEATYTVGRRMFFAGQRADAFHVDLGSIFDLGGLRPLNTFHAFPLATMDGINAVQSYNCHTIAMMVPAGELTSNGKAPEGIGSRQSVIGVWATASRRAGNVFKKESGKFVGNGPFTQVSRLANPLFNEVLVPMAEKDVWNASEPKDDKSYMKYVRHPELAALLPGLYPGVFPNLEAYTKPRKDLDAILLTGIPAGVVAGTDFQNYTGPVKADMLRLNMAVPPTAPEDENPLGVVGGDLAGFPNGRRINDDVVTIELRAVAGATIPLVDPDYVVDDAVSLVADGTTQSNGPLLDEFPFLGLPNGGYQTTPGTSTSGELAG